MKTSLEPTRRTVLSLLAVTAASWWGPAQAQAGALPQLRIGFQKGSLNLALLKSLGLLEKRLPASKISWAEFPAGPQLLEALAVGSVDFGATGDAPPVFAQAANKDLFYVGAEPPKPDSSAILVKPDAPLKSLADLKGRRIALQKGSSAHFLLVQTVKKAGLQWAEIQPVYLPPADARAAFERGAVDAWVIWDPYYAAAEVDGPVRVLATSRGLTGNNTFYLASRIAYRQRADAARAVRRAHRDRRLRADASQGQRPALRRLRRPGPGHRAPFPGAAPALAGGPADTGPRRRTAEGRRQLPAARPDPQADSRGRHRLVARPDVGSGALSASRKRPR